MLWPSVRPAEKNSDKSVPVTKSPFERTMQVAADHSGVASEVLLRWTGGGMNACSGGTRWRPTFAAAAAANSMCSPQSALSWQLLSAVTSGGIDRSEGRTGRSVGKRDREGIERRPRRSGGSFIRRGAIKPMIGYLNGRRKEGRTKGREDFFRAANGMESCFPAP